MAISEALGISPSVMAAGVAADNVICAIYFIILFALASKVPSEPSIVKSGLYSLSVVITAFSLSYADVVDLLLALALLQMLQWF